MTQSNDPVQASDAPITAATPKAKAPFNPTWISAICAVLAVSTVLYTQCTSPLKSIDDHLKKVDEQITSANTHQLLTDQKVELALNWVRKNDPKFPGGTTAPPAPSGAPPMTSASAAPVASAPVIASLPSSARTIPPPVCVSPKTKRRFPCEEASECHPESGYNPDFFASLKKSAHAEAIVVCDHK